MLDFQTLPPKPLFTLPDDISYPRNFIFRSGRFEENKKVIRSVILIPVELVDDSFFPEINRLKFLIVDASVYEQNACMYMYAIRV